MEKKIIKIPEFISVRDFSQKLGVSPASIISTALKLGTPITINQELDFETAQILAFELGCEVEKEEVKSKYSPPSLEEILAKEKPENLQKRPPIVAVMGHVDHGKTSLLDAFLKTNLVAKEKGGITQHIGAFEVEKNGQRITFIDTPGHEAFVALRARGAQITDIVILVVAADEGVKPQTKEAIMHCRQAKVPIIVALTKIDKPEADIIKVKQQLAEEGLVCEDWGGKTICIPTSVITNEGIDELLEMVLLVADLENFQANPNGFTLGTVIEAHKDPQRGNLASVIVQNGTLRVGDIIVCGKAYGKIRFMEDFQGRRIKEAYPSKPVRIFGLSEIPFVGDVFWVVESEKEAKEIAREAEILEKNKKIKESIKVDISKLSEEDSKYLKIILKADVWGSLEAISHSLSLLGNEEVKPLIIKEGVGDITESDIVMAHTANAEILGFNVKVDPAARLALKRNSVKIKIFQIIYELIDYVHKRLEEMLEPEIVELLIGKVKVVKIFKKKGKNMVVGGIVESGKIERNVILKIFKDKDFKGEAQVINLKRYKDDVKEVTIGKDCGIEIYTEAEVEPGDIIEVYKKEERKRTL